MLNARAIDPPLVQCALDHWLEQLQAGRIAEVMGELAVDLFDCRAALSPGEWKKFVGNTVLAHPIREFIHRDPFTYRSFAKPRGYAGDAVMLDLIYRGWPDGLPDEDGVAKVLLGYTTNRPAPCAVRNRARKLAELIDDSVERRNDARILALASGHLREIEAASSTVGAFRGEIVAFDQDAESLAVVERDYSGRGVRVLHASIKHLLAGRLDLRGFDLVYAAGLFDYLPQPVAKSLCERMFDMLNPGGRIFVANFAPGIPDVGYMESLMDWHLIYRDEAAMRGLVSGIPRERITDLDVSLDVTRNVVYLSAVARG